MTTISDHLGAAFDALLTVGGHLLTASTGETELCLIENADELTDPVDNMVAESPIYSRIAAKKGAFDTPRAVATFTDADGKTYTVRRYIENVFGVKDEWIVEKQRA